VQSVQLNTGREPSGWDLENGYPPNGKLDTFPNRALGAGAMSGLFILLKGNESDLDFLCRGPVQGFKVRATRQGLETTDFNIV